VQIGRDVWRAEAPASAANPCGAGVSVVTHPMDGRAFPRQAVTIGLAVHPTHPLLAELVACYPPFAAVLGAVAAMVPIFPVMRPLAL
jgi:hypothetical protein